MSHAPCDILIMCEVHYERHTWDGVSKYVKVVSGDVYLIIDVWDF